MEIKTVLLPVVTDSFESTVEFIKRLQGRVSFFPLRMTGIN